MLLFAVVLVFLAFVIAIVLFKRRAPNFADQLWPFYAKKPLTQPEQVLYHRLVAALPECIVLAQVQLSRILGVKKGFQFHQWNNRINRLSVDFLVCLKDSTVVAAVELDDRSHARPDRVEADSRKARALAAAAIPLIRWNVDALPDQDAIRQAFER